jgi:hypothetical protein
MLLKMESIRIGNSAIDASRLDLSTAQRYTPVVTLDGSSVRNGYQDRTLVMFDASAKNYVHWMVEYIGRQAARTLVSYRPPSPPPGSGAHRYVFALFEGSLPVPRSRADGLDAAGKHFIDAKYFIASA